MKSVLLMSLLGCACLPASAASVDPPGDPASDVAADQPAPQPVTGNLPVTAEQQQVDDILSALEGLGGGEEILIILRSQISVANLEGKAALAERYAERLLDASRKAGNRPMTGTAQYYLGIAAESREDFARAIDLFEESLVNLEGAADSGDLRKQALLHLGIARHTVGDLPEAADAYRKLEQAARQSGDRKSIALCLLAQAAIVLLKDEPTAAKRHLTESLEIARALNDRLLASQALMTLGIAAALAGEHRDAIVHWQGLLQLTRLPAHGPGAELEKKGEVIALNLLAYAHANLQEDKRALELAGKAVMLTQAESMEAERALALDARSFVHYRAGRLPEAEADARSSIRLLDELRSRMKTADLAKAGAFDQHSVPYDLLQKTLVLRGKPDEALVAAELGKARAFAEALGEQGGRAVSLESFVQTARNLNATLVEYSILHDPAQYLLPGRLDGLQRPLEDVLLIWVIRPDGRLAQRSVDLAALRQQRGGETLDQSVRLFLQSLDSHAGGLTSSLARDLHDTLIAPIADLLPADPDAPVVIVPHGVLHLVPFPALLRADGRFLIEHHTLLNMPSIEALARLADRRSARKATGSGVLIVGNPSTLRADSLPSAEGEARSIADQLGAKALVRERATKTEVVRGMQGARLIHVASHGFLGRANAGGIPGALALAPSGDEDDGFLAASEIRGLQLTADVVVLSACETGRGRLSGDGVIGLSRSFLLAGAGGVVSSLWRIDDEATAALMIDFHRLLASSNDPARALRKSMVAAIARGDNPGYWAAFNYLGAPK